MRPKGVVFSQRSLRDLEAAHGWICAQSQSAELADLWARDLLTACESLALLPERFAAYPPAKRWRMMPFRGYLVFFTIQGDEVRIGHIRHGENRLKAEICLEIRDGRRPPLRISWGNTRIDEGLSMVMIRKLRGSLTAERLGAT